MDFERLVTSRHSVRTYQDRPVEAEKVEAILEAGRLAPSACNNQPTRVVVCDTPELRAAAGRATGRFNRDGS
ncbi:nitroreductase family protein, partial [Acinetobacter baumannii]|nr:nitroreductase family protein [Acinetobacter baumannii]